MKHRPNKHPAGFTIIELLIGLALSGVIILAVTSVFLSNAQTYRLNVAQSQIQESGRLAIELLSQDIHMAGTWSCAGNSLEPENGNVDISSDDLSPGFFRNTLNPVAASAAGYFQRYEVPITGHQRVNNNWDNDANNNLQFIIGASVPDNTSDILTIRRGGSRTFDITPNSYSSNAIGANVSFTSNALANELEWDEPLFLIGPQCNYGAVVAVNRAANGDITLTDNAAIPGPHYESGYLGQAVSTTYFIAQSAINPDLNALWVYSNGGDNNGDAEELLTGVQAMRIHYGIGNAEVDQYVRSSNVNNWNDVRAIRIQLITAGDPPNVSDNPQNFTLVNFDDANDIIALPGNRIGQSFTTTVTIRNRFQ